MQDHTGMRGEATESMVDKHDVDRLGYSQEEDYFYHLNRELIDRQRKVLDVEKRRAVRLQNWMKCPKCGGTMKEVDLTGIKVEQCERCQGVYFDYGELDILMQSKAPKGFLNRMRRLLLALDRVTDPEWRP